MGYLQSIIRDSKPLQDSRVRFTHNASAAIDSPVDHQPSSYQYTEPDAQSEPMGDINTSVTPSVSHEHPLSENDTKSLVHYPVPTDSIPDANTTTQTGYTVYESPQGVEHEELNNQHQTIIQASLDFLSPSLKTPNTSTQEQAVVNREGKQTTNQAKTINVENDAYKQVVTQAPGKSAEPNYSMAQTNIERTDMPEMGRIEKSTHDNTIGQDDKPQQSIEVVDQTVHEASPQAATPHFDHVEPQENTATVITSHAIDESPTPGLVDSVVQPPAQNHAPQVHIGQIDIIVTAPDPQPRTQPASSQISNELASRLYLRGL